MSNTILFTPSNEQLVQIANEHPQLNEEIKSAVLEELKHTGVKYTQKRLQHQINQSYEELYNKIQKNFFTSGNGWSSGPAKFSPELEKKFTQQIEVALSTALEEEFSSYLTSPQFKNLLKSKIRERMLAAVLKGLDSEILEQTKKLML